MPLAWYSKDTDDDLKRVYHVCTDCQHITKFKPEYLVFMSACDSVESMTKRVVCEDCADHQHVPADWRRRMEHHPHCKAYFSEDVLKAISQMGG